METVTHKNISENVFDHLLSLDRQASSGTSVQFRDQLHKYILAIISASSESFIYGEYKYVSDELYVDFHGEVLIVS
jgi:hypothetical protein